MWKKHAAADAHLFFVEDGALDPEEYTHADLKI